MAYMNPEGEGKTAEGRNFQRAVVDAQKRISPELYAHVEQELPGTVSAEWLRMEAKQTRQAAVDAVVRNAEAKGYKLDDGELKTAVKEQYREFIKNPDARDAHLASRVRG